MDTFYAAQYNFIRTAFTYFYVPPNLMHTKFSQVQSKKIMCTQILRLHNLKKIRIAEFTLIEWKFNYTKFCIIASISPLLLWVKTWHPLHNLKFEFHEQFHNDRKQDGGPHLD